MIFLPKVSLSGARIRGPTPSMITKPVWQPMTAFSVVSRDAAICLMPGANIELAKGLRTAMTAMTATFPIFVHLDHARGFDWSSLENSSSWASVSFRLLSGHTYLSVFLIPAVLTLEKRSRLIRVVMTITARHAENQPKQV